MVVVLGIVAKESCVGGIMLLLIGTTEEMRREQVR
jgi:hypothetical protein